MCRLLEMKASELARELRASLVVGILLSLLVRALLARLSRVLTFLLPLSRCPALVFPSLVVGACLVLSCLCVCLFCLSCRVCMSASLSCLCVCRLPTRHVPQDRRDLQQLSGTPPTSFLTFFRVLFCIAPLSMYMSRAGFWLCFTSGLVLS